MSTHRDVPLLAFPATRHYERPFYVEVPLRHFFPTVLAGLAVAAVGCTDPVLEQRLADLEQKVAEMEKAPPAARAAERAPSAATPEQEEAAAELLREANTLVTAMKYDEAKAKLADLAKDYPTTRAARSSSRMAEELAVVGIAAGDLGIEKWFQGNVSMNDGKATLVVFWESWCPHCRREVPAIEAVFAKYKDDGLNVVGVTKVTKSSTDEKVAEFIEENKVTYPMGKESGELSARFGVRGIPAAAVVKDGKVVWRGHPARLTDDMYRAWLGLGGGEG